MAFVRSHSMLDLSEYKTNRKFYFTVTYGRQKFRLKISNGKINEDILERYLDKYPLARTLILERIWIERADYVPQFIKRKVVDLTDLNDWPIKIIVQNFFYKNELNKIFY